VPAQKSQMGCSSRPESANTASPIKAEKNREMAGQPMGGPPHSASSMKKDDEVGREAPVGYRNGQGGVGRGIYLNSKANSSQRLHCSNGGLGSVLASQRFEQVQSVKKRMSW
jgi:hypothetical protein